MNEANPAGIMDIGERTQREVIQSAAAVIAKAALNLYSHDRHEFGTRPCQNRRLHPDTNAEGAVLSRRGFIKEVVGGALAIASGVVPETTKKVRKQLPWWCREHNLDTSMVEEAGCRIAAAIEYQIIYGCPPPKGWRPSYRGSKC